MDAVLSAVSGIKSLGTGIYTLVDLMNKLFNSFRN